MNTATLIVIAIAVAIALLFLFLVRGRKQHVTFNEPTPLPRAATPAHAPAPASTGAMRQPEGHGVGAEIADAIEDVIDQFVGIHSHSTEEPAGPGDELTRLKGLGPKAASRLQELGVTRFEQIASWNAADIAAIDAEMGAFKGRIARDRWVEQAKLLAKGDTETFEAAFGKLGG